MANPNVPGVLASAQLSAITQAIQGLDNQQLSWVSGYIAGLASAQGGGIATTEAPANQAQLTVLYGSQTGNAKGVAHAFAEKANAYGINAKVVSMADYQPIARSGRSSPGSCR